jgi:peptidoglycan/xylan/chitin deacetylase (PgdA/CDA1 family)
MLSELHQRAYGPTKGIWKILSLIEEHEVPGTFYIPGYTALLHTDMVKAIVKKGYAIGLHGYLHESLDSLDQTAEESILLRSKNVLQRMTGYQSIIYRSPSWELNRWTPDLLLKHGVRSDSSLMDDEVPYALETAAGSLIEIPIQWMLDDAEHWGHTRANRDKAISDPDTVFRIWSSEFDGYYKSSGCYVLTLHPFISGRWAYIHTIDRLVRYIKGHSGVWWTTMDRVTKYSEQLLASGKLQRKKMVSPQPIDFRFD